MRSPSRCRSHATISETPCYRSIAGRERGCRNELRLNRRLAPSVYVGVVPLVRRRNGELALGRGRSVVDWLIKMHRLLAARMLDRAIAADTVGANDLEALTGLLVAFFKGAKRVPVTGPQCRKPHRARAQQNARDLCAPDLRLNRSRVEKVMCAQLEFIAAGADVLEARGARLLEGHGDLRPEHVCLGPRPCESAQLTAFTQSKKTGRWRSGIHDSISHARSARGDRGTASIRGVMVRSVIVGIRP